MVAIWRSGMACALVVAKKSLKTAKVAIRRKVIHKKYKWIKYTRSYLLVHDELDQCTPGDKVIIKQCKPYSKLKRFMVYEISEKYRPYEFLQRHPELDPAGIKDRTDVPPTRLLIPGVPDPQL